MKNPNRLMLAVAVLALAISCKNLDNSPLAQTLQDGGGEIVDQIVMIGDTGVTFLGEDRSFVTYFSPDGRKVVKLPETGEIRELTWRKNDAQQFCQGIFDTGKENCHNVILVREKDGAYRTFDRKDGRYNTSDGHSGQPFTVVTGNPEGL